MSSESGEDMFWGVDKKLFTLKLVMLSFLSLQFAAQMASGLLSVPRFVMCI
jgi:hypothetical protein